MEGTRGALHGLVLVEGKRLWKGDSAAEEDEDGTAGVCKTFVETKVRPATAAVVFRGLLLPGGGDILQGRISV